MSTISLLLIISLTSPTWSIPPARVQYGTTSINWRLFRVDQWWGESSNAERAQAICVASAWAGTATVFALAPWHNNPKVMRAIQIAGVVGVAGLFGNFIFAGLRPR